jgi:Leucine-rich repeat (LRR) protein
MESGYILEIVRQSDQSIATITYLPSPQFLPVNTAIQGLDANTTYEARMRAYVRTNLNYLVGINNLSATFSTRESLCTGRITQIPMEECQALEAIYFSLGGPNWSGNWTGQFSNRWYEAFGNGYTVPTWAYSQPCDGWKGVTCDANKATVIGIGGLDSLVGIIPSQVGDLSNLQSLNLHGGNNLTGTIPSELGNLSDLRYLAIYGQLTGSIPASLGNLTNLTNLRLGNNQLSGALPPELGSLQSLQYLELNKNLINASIPPEIWNLRQLQYLNLSQNQLSGSIPPELGNLTNLVTLELYSNNLTGQIPAEIGYLSQLRDLKLAWNQLSGTIPANLGNLQNLQSLVLRTNQLSGPIPPELGNLENLTMLSLSQNQLGGSIPVELGNLENLVNLSLDQNSLVGSIPSTIGNLSNLQSLNLSYNQLTGSIPYQLGSIHSLDSLRLDHNQLSGQIPSSLGNLTNLIQFNLSTNSLTGEIPSSLANLTNLTFGLYLGNNGLWTYNTALQNFITSYDTYAFTSQTIPPSNITIIDRYLDGFSLRWTPIPYSGSGYYQVSCSPNSGGPYAPAGDISTTLNKSTTGITIRGLEPGSTQFCVVTTTSLNMTSVPSPEFSVNVGALAGSTNYVPAYPDLVNPITSPDETFIIYADLLVPGEFDDLAACDITSDAGRSVIFQGSPSVFGVTSGVGRSVIFSTEGSTVDTVISVYFLDEGSALSPEQLRQVACNDDSEGSSSSWVELKIIDGVLYDADGNSIQMDADDLLVIVVEIRGTPSADDKVLLNIDTQPFESVTDTSEPTQIEDPNTVYMIPIVLADDSEFDDLSSCDITGNAGRSVIFQGSPAIFGATAGVGRSVIFSTEGSTLDTVVSVYLLQGGDPIAPEYLIPLACNDNAAADGSSAVMLKIIDGIAYDANGNPYVLGPDDQIVVIIEVREPVDLNDLAILDIITSMLVAVEDTSSPTSIEPDTVYTVPADLLTANVYDSLATCDLTQDGGRSVIFQGSSAIFGDTVGGGRSVIFSTEGSTADTILSAYYLEGGALLSPETLQLLACNDDFGTLLTSLVKLNMIDGVLYDANGDTISFTPDDLLIVIVEIRGEVDSTDLVVLSVESQAFVLISDPSQVTSIEPDTVYTVPADLLTTSMYDYLATCDLTQDGGRSVIFQGSSAIFGDTVGGGRSVIFSTEGSTADTILSVYYLEGGALLSPETLQLLACNDDFGTLLTSLVKVNMIDGVLYDANGDTISFTPDDLLIVIVEIRGEVSSSDDLLLSVETEPLQMIAETTPITDITEPDIVYISRPEYTSLNPEFDGKSSCDPTQDGGRSVIFQGSVDLLSSTNVGGRSVIFSDTRNSSMDTVLTMYYLDGSLSFAYDNMVEVTCNDNNFDQRTSFVQAVLKGNQLTLSDGTMLTVTPDDSIILVAQTRGNPTLSDELRVRIGHLDQTFDPNVATVLTQPNSIYITQPLFVDPKPPLDGTASCDTSSNAGESVVFRAGIGVFGNTDADNRSIIFSSTEGSSLDTVLVMYLHRGTSTMPLDVGNLVEISCSDDSSQNVRDIGGPGTETVVTEGNLQPPPGSLALTSFTSAVFQDGILYTQDGRAITTSPDDELIIVAQTRGTATVEDKLRILIGTELVDPMIQVSRAEAFALSAIYDSTDGDQWTNTLNNDRVWFVTAEPCGRDGIPAWYGITCDMNHRIIALDLANNGLQGPIPPQISYLLSLSRLTIQNNMLIGEIPGTITTLTQLGSLDIDYNALTASGTTATYINRLDPNGLATQTIAPKNVQMGSLTDNSALLSWTPIQFTAFDGGYQAFCSTQSGGPYVASGIVANKTSTQMTVSGLVAGTTYYCVVGSYTLPHGEQINTLNSLYSLEVAATTSLPLGLSKVAGSQNTFEFDGTTQFPFIFRANSQHLPRGDAFTSSCTPDGTVPVRGHSVIFRGTSNVFGDPTGGLSVLIGQADKNSCITILSESNGIFSELASTASSVTAYASEGEVVAQAEILGDRMYYIQYVVMTEGDIVLTTDVRSNFEPAVTTLADITVPEDSDPTSIDVYAIFNDVEDADAQLTYTIVHTNPQLVTISELDPLTGNIVLSYATNQYGEDFVTIRATDSTGLFGETTINVTVEAVNDAPTARTIDPITVTENDPATFSDLSQVFTDVEDEPAALLVAVDSNTNPSLFDAIAIDPVTHLMTVDFAPNRYGEADITLSATDSGGLSVEVIVQITVQPLRTTGSITIAVDAIPDSGRDWNFSGSLGNFTLDDDDTFADASPIFHRLYFADLLPGTYSIAELNIVEPNSWGLDNISCQLMDNNPAVAFRTETASVTIELSAGQDITCVFTNRRLGSLIVTTFNDLNGDGVLQNKEPLMAGIPIQVYSLNNPSQLVAYLNTDQLGRARFSGLLVGLYSVCEILPDGWISSSTSVEGSCQIVEILPGKTVRAFYGNISGDLGALSAAEGPQIVESDTALVSQFGLWELMNDRSDASNGTYLRSTGPDTALLLQFSGTSAEVEYLGGPHFGDFVVEIDGILSVTGYGTMEDDTSGLSIIIDNLPNGVHLMRVRPLSTLPVAIDTFVIVVPEMVESTPTSVTPTGTDSAITATATEPITTETEVPVTPTSEPSLSAEPTATIPATFESSPTSEPTVEGTATTNLAPLPTVAPSQPVSDTQVPTDMPAPSPTGAGS